MLWEDTTVTSARQAFLDGLTIGVKAPTGKGGRLIILHAGSESGFVREAKEVFRAKKSDGDYHGEMNSQHFEEWFTENILPNIQPNSVIVMDKADMQAWLTEKGVPWNDEMVKAELMVQVNSVQEKYNTYRIDTIAENSGHTVLRLPPYHCELNPIEEVWSEVKRYVGSENRTFTLSEVETLVHTSFDRLPSQHWHNYVRHAIEEENRMWKADGLTDIMIDKLIINTASSSDDDDE